MNEREEEGNRPKSELLYLRHTESISWIKPRGRKWRDTT